MAFDTQRGKVLAALIARFQAMTIAGGYHYDVQAASVVSDPVNILTVPDPLLPFFLVEPSPSSRVYWPAMRTKIDAHFLVTARVLANGTSPTRKVEAGENLIGDVEKAIATDITLGGLVIDARLQEPDGPMVGMGTNNNVFVLLDILTIYTRVYGAP
jgi:hypothetical protein